MTVELREPTEAVDNIRLPTLLKLLAKNYGQDWQELEDETISLGLGLRLTPLLLDKISVLRIISDNPDMFFTDFLFFLHACDVLNNHVADFSVFPSPNSLEIAWAVTEMKNLVQEQYSDEIKTGVTKLLNEEGYSSAPGPLAEVCFPEKLVEGQEVEDRQAKDDAVSQYIEFMEKTK